MGYFLSSIVPIIRMAVVTGAQKDPFHHQRQLKEEKVSINKLLFFCFYFIFSKKFKGESYSPLILVPASSITSCKAESVFPQE